MSSNRLFTPGPTPIPEKVIQKMSEPIVYHRSEEFRHIFERVNINLQYLFQTKQPVLTLSCSGTGGMEAIIVNLFSAGDTVININGGKFGERWGIIARTYGLNVVEIKIEWGIAVTAAQIFEELRKHPEVKGVFLTHSETSTATSIDLKSIAKVIKENSSALVIVDGISAIGALEFRFDEWSIDACVTASQKGLMVPPGLSFIALSDRAIQSFRESTLPKYYFDFQRALTSYKKNDTPWTPAITLVKGLDASLQMIVTEGLENVWKRHEHLSMCLRGGLKKLGLRIFSENPSYTVTAVWIPDGLDWKKINQELISNYNVILAPGQGEYLGKIFRIAHLGYYNEDDINFILSILKSIF
jgi:aspartate aminotransferase-like enzyme